MKMSGGINVRGGRNLGRGIERRQRGYFKMGRLIYIGDVKESFQGTLAILPCQTKRSDEIVGREEKGR